MAGKVESALNKLTAWAVRWNMRTSTFEELETAMRAAFDEDNRTIADLRHRCEALEKALVEESAYTQETLEHMITGAGVARREITTLTQRCEAAERALSEATWKAHVPVTGTQHDPSRGLLHGYCERCRAPWPCEYSPEYKAALSSTPPAKGDDE